MRMTADASILTFRDVALATDANYDSGLSDVSFTLPPGSLMHVTVPAHESRHPLCDAAQGLILPESGTITFDAERWDEASPSAAAAMRAKTGRVFREGGWLNNLDLDENITLRLRHHSRQGEEEIRSEAEALAARLGLDGLPGERPAWIGRGVLKRAQWVRALVGSPRLILLDDPARDVGQAHVAALGNVLKDALQGGAAVLWVSPNLQSLEDAQLQPDAKYRILDGRWTADAPEQTT